MATDRGLASVPRGLERGLTQYLQSLDAMVRRLSGTVRGSGESRAVRASEASTAFTGGGASASVDIGTLANLVGTQVLRDSAVTERKIADNAVTGRKLATGAVAAEKIGENAVTRKAIAPGEVITNALAEGAVTTSKIAAGAVKSGNIAQGAITSSAISQGAVTSSAIAQGAVTSSAIAQGAVTSDKLAPGVIPEIPAVPVFVSGEAKDGDLVTIPGTWELRPDVLLTWFEAVAEETIREETGENGEIVAVSLHTSRAGAVNIHEKDDEPGVWLFEAAGRFSWVAVCRC